MAHGPGLFNASIGSKDVYEKGMGSSRQRLGFDLDREIEIWLNPTQI